MRIPIFFTIILFFFSKHEVLPAYANCLSDEQSLLLNLKNSLIFNTSLSTKLSKWKPGSTSFDGVTCEEGLVIGLDLSNESIYGGINASSSLFSLEYLQMLNLAFNNFNNSEIPSQLGKLSRLHYLNLSSARFAGQVPVAISELTKLTTLDLSTVYLDSLYFQNLNDLAETNSLQLKNPNLKMLVGNLGELRKLYLDGVNVSAPGAEWCGALSSSLPKLQVLSMSFCYLSGPIDRSLVNLRNLSVIRLNGNNLSTTVPDFFADFSNLISLRLREAGFYGKFPERIFTVPSLQILDLSYNSLLSGSLPEFPRGGSLQTVYLSSTGFSGVLPNSIGYLQNLSQIDLESCSFSGKIPSSMANLTRLVYLDFSYNNFTGSIPSFSLCRNLTSIIFSHNGLSGQIKSTHWEYLQNLQNLDLRNNLLEGGIPSSLFKLPLIQNIDLSQNRFSGALKIDGSLNFSSYQLEMIDLSSNNLEGRLPMALLEFPELTSLSLSFNSFSGSMDIKAFQQVPRLSFLDLSYNRLFINVDGMGSFPTIMNTVKLAFCHLRKFPYFLKDQVELFVLDLSNNEIEGKIPEWFWNLTNLMALNLSSNFLEGAETHLWNLPSRLYILDLHDNKFQGPMPPVPLFANFVDYSSNNLSSAIPENIGDNLFGTMFFSLSNNRLNGSIPSSICNATGYLQVLDLSSNNLTGSIPSCLMKDSILKVLNLRNNSFTGGIPDIFPLNCGLKTLDLWRNQLQGKLPQSLERCTSLEVLNVGSNRIEDVFPCHLKNTSQLRVLVLRSNRFSGQIGCPLVENGWSFLQIVDLANNNFTGLPPENYLSSWRAMQVNVDINLLQHQFLGSELYYQDSVTVTLKGFEIELVKILTVFTTIDFSSNRIEGSIPAAIGNFTALRLLNLSHNVLSGPIPLSLGNMKVLESLDLSENQLRGTIPPQLTNINFLSVLNLSDNEFVGKIPVGKQFNTFSEDSYRGNTGLCGEPLERKCGSTDESPVEKPEAGFNDDDDEVVFGWEFFVAIGIGFVGGATTVVACLGSNDLLDKFLLLFQSRRWF